MELNQKLIEKYRSGEIGMFVTPRDSITLLERILSEVYKRKITVNLTPTTNQYVRIDTTNNQIVYELYPKEHLYYPTPNDFIERV